MYKKNLAIERIISIISSSILISISLIVLVDYYFEVFNFNLSQIFWLSLISTITIYIKLLTKKIYNKTGFHMLILTYTILCHFGFLFASHINFDASMIRSSNTMKFILLDEYVTSLKISLFVIIMFVLFLRNTKNNKKKHSLIFKNRESGDSLSGNKEIKMQKSATFVSLSIQLFGFIYLLTLIKNGYLDVPYVDRHGLIRELKLYGHIEILLSFAFVVMIVATDFKRWKYSLLLFLLTSAIHLLLGNRGEVLYSAVTCLSVYSLKYKKINYFYLIFIFIGIIILIPLIRNFRSFSNLNTSSVSVSNSIIEVLSETGFQIAPFTYTVKKVRDGIGFQYGGTYLFGLSDFVLRKIPFSSPINFETSFNIKYILPEDGLGFSHIAEAWYNFGILGAGIYFAFLSKILLKIERIFINEQSSVYLKIFVSLLVVELVNLTRNSFVTFYVYLTWIFLILLLIKSFERVNFK